VRGPLRERERLERRVLGALRCIDATTLAQVDDPLSVSASDARLVRNRSGLYVIRSWTRLAAHEQAFDEPPASPSAGSESLPVEVRDPSGRYLGRRVAIALPRDPSPAHADEPGSLFRAVDVPMYPSASAPVSANWVELRVTVRETASGDALGGALLRVVAGSRVLARGLTDWRGEALVPVSGVPVTTWSTEPGAVVVTEIAGSLECYFDSAAATRTPAANVRAGIAPDNPPLPDPQAIDDARAVLPQSITPVVLAAGRSIAVAISITVR
jgi:hypothetical protein